MERNERGFSLIELVLVMAIIGLLSSIAIPNFNLMQEKARQVEAKNLLSSVALAEKIYSGEYSVYTTEFDQLSLQFEGAMHYSVGFGIYWPDLQPGAPYHPPGGFCCHNGCYASYSVPTYSPGDCNPNYLANISGNCNMPFGNPDPANGTLWIGTFNVMATGLLNDKGYSDDWTLDDQGHLVNTQSGL
jgi:prepilin-type N-terminal cleavage/methylation domain-containing protein